MADQAQYFEGVGRRKEASARVRIYPAGQGNVIINDRPGEEFLPREGDLITAMSPLTLMGWITNYNVSVHVNGGGITGQSEAIRLGVARAILKVDPEARPQLRKAGFLTRDARVKERKKPGLKRARKAGTYTKR